MEICHGHLERETHIFKFRSQFDPRCQDFCTNQLGTYYLNTANNLNLKYQYRKFSMFIDQNLTFLLFIVLHTMKIQKILCINFKKNLTDCY